MCLFNCWSKGIHRPGNIRGHFESFKVLDEHDPRMRWPTVYKQTFISQCQWCWPDQVSGFSLAIRDKVREMGSCQEVRVTHVLTSRAPGFRFTGTSTLCPLVPVPVQGTRDGLIYAWMNCYSVSKDSTPSPWLFAPVHQQTKNTLLSCF